MTLTQALSQNWIISDKEALTGRQNMAIDGQALELLSNEPHHQPILRFFQWVEPTITYGYLLDPVKVEAWAKKAGFNTVVQRPTGGGAVLHDVTDLSISLAWARGQSILPDQPREAYGAIHECLLKAIQKTLRDPSFDLHTRSVGECNENGVEANQKRFSLCFQEPVCNDVMSAGKKIAGGALRITKSAILYQGTVQLRHQYAVSELKSNFTELLFSS